MNDIGKHMQAAMEALDEHFNGNAKGADKKIGIILLTFPFGEVKDGRVNYIGNGERETVLLALKELVARWEGRYAESRSVQ